MKSSVTALRLLLITGACCRFGFGQPALLEPKPCEGLVFTAPPEPRTIVKVDLENRTDAILHISMIRNQDGTRWPPMILRPRFARRISAPAGETFIVEDESGKCLATYKNPAENSRMKIGEKDLQVRVALPPYRLQTTVFRGFGIQPDAEEVYVDAQNISSQMCDALSLWLGVSPAVAKANYPCAGPKREQQSARTRHLIFDLSKPISASGAKPLGLIRDDMAAIHVFLSHDHEVRIHSIQELRPGSKAQSERVEFGVSIDGIPHTMLVGPWGPGEFNRIQTKPLHGEGTTRAEVKRLSETVWEVQAPEGSLGRLWNNADKAKPIDRGLYRVSFRFRFELLPETAE